MTFWAGNVAQLPSKSEALSSKPSNVENNNKNNSPVPKRRGMKF
jgi:hypothetical protein